MTKLAGFPMYDFPEIRSSTDAFWRCLHDDLLAHNVSDVPLELVRPTDLPAFWQDSNLLIGQTCGYPFMMGLCGDAQYVATPHYHSRFSSGSEHKSVIITHRDAAIKTLQDAHGKICAINMSDSNSGMNLLRLEIAKLEPHPPFFAHVYETYAHRKSMLAVACGEADIAAIDCISFAHIEKIDPVLTGKLRILGETESTPNLPFITSKATDAVTLARLRDALHRVTSNPNNRDLMASLMLDGVSILSADAYNRIIEIENRAIALGYPQLR